MTHYACVDVRRQCLQLGAHRVFDKSNEIDALMGYCLTVARMCKRLADACPEVTERIEHLTQTLDAGISLKRRIMEDLHTSSLFNLGLTPSLAILCSELANNSGIMVSLRLPPEVQIGVYRLIQEALTTIAKHAQAQHVEVAFFLADGWITALVCDDGVGFDTSAVSLDTDGLAGMRFRIRSAMGELSVQSATGQGCCITCRYPDRPPAEPPKASTQAQKLELATRAHL